VWERADRAVNEVLESATFAQLAREWADKQTQFIPNWDI